MPQPRSLERLSLNAFGNYFYNLSAKLAPEHIYLRPGSTEICEENLLRRKVCRNAADKQKVKQTLKNLHEYLVRRVPFTLVNRVTDTLLNHLSRIEMYDEKSGIVSEENKMYFEELLRSILHPAITRIEETENRNDCPNFFPNKKFGFFRFLSQIMRAVKHLENLRALHLFRNVKCSEISTLPAGLEEFSGFCNDESLAVLANSCKHLKILNISESFEITDASVDTLLKMENLQKLNISEVNITKSGITNLLNGFVQKGDSCKLKLLEFSGYVSKHLKILEELPNIKASLKNEYFSTWMADAMFSPSDFFKLRNLIQLHITCGSRHLNDLMREIGSQLLMLEIKLDSEDCVLGVDNMMAIGLHCTSLKCLHLRGTLDVARDMADYPRTPLTGFHSMSCLIMDVESKFKQRGNILFKNLLYFVVSQCVNATRVTIPEDRCFYNRCDLVNELLGMGCLKNVEDICFKPVGCACAAGEQDRAEVEREKQTFQLLRSKCLRLRRIRRDYALLGSWRLGF